MSKETKASREPEERAALPVRSKELRSLLLRSEASRLRGQAYGRLQYQNERLRAEVKRLDEAIQSMQADRAAGQLETGPAKWFALCTRLADAITRLEEADRCGSDEVSIMSDRHVVARIDEIVAEVQIQRACVRRGQARRA